MCLNKIHFFFLMMTYKVVGRSIINYDAPVWSTNLRDTNYRNIQYTQNEALSIATGYHKMSSVDHLHVETEMLKVREHSELLSAQYLARCLEPKNVCHSYHHKRRMKETLFTRACRKTASWSGHVVKLTAPRLRHAVKLCPAQGML